MNAPFIVDEKKIFKTNQHSNVQIFRIGEGKHKVVVIDHFYKNPTLVRKLIIKSPSTNSKEIIAHSPGFRCATILDLSEPLKRIEKLLKKNFHDTYAAAGFYQRNLHSNFIGNLITTKPPASKGQVSPHWDSKSLVGVIYLNPKNESKGGTAFYRHKATNLERIPFNQYQLKTDRQKLRKALDENNLKDLNELRNFLDRGNKDYIDYISDSNNHWELIEMIPMKFNRLVLYEGNLFHSSYLKKNWFKKKFRLTQTFAF